MKRLATYFLFLLVWSLGATASPAQTSPDISWHVVDRFRLFISEPSVAGLSLETQQTSPQDLLLQKLAAIPQDDQQASKVHDALLEFLSQPHTIGGRVDFPYRRTSWRNREDTAQERRYDDNYLYPDRYVISAVSNFDEKATCNWSIGASKLQAPCAKRVRFSVEVAKNKQGSQKDVLVVEAVADDGTRYSSSVEIEVKDRLIASLGDSFASGEGNPDRPQDMSRLVVQPRKWDSDFKNRWWIQKRHLKDFELAQWSDGWCHRSLMTQHFTSSILYAARNPHDAVTYVSFACSGASIRHGFLFAQTKPPGTPEFGQAPNQLTQIEALQEIRCKNRIVFQSRAAENLLKAFANSPDDAFSPKQLGRKGTGVQGNCKDGSTPRPVDVLLLSMGGNDVGFSGTVVDTILPTEVSDVIGQQALKFTRRALGAQTLDQAKSKLTLLGDRLKAQQLLIREVLGTGVVINSTYPNPLKVGDIYCGGSGHDEMLTALAGIYPDKYVREEKRWKFQVNPKRAEAADRELVDPLNRMIASTSEQDTGWKINDAFGDEFALRGWCAGSDTHSVFPNWDSSSEKWNPFTPSNWQAYEKRARLFRTPNDAALTQISSRRGLNQLIITLREGPIRATAGAFHPTFEGHTVMGVSGALLLEDTLQ